MTDANRDFCGLSADSGWYTYRTAARRVKRDQRTIRRWQAAGMRMEWRMVEGQRARVVREDVLLAWFRQTLQNSPVHHYRMWKFLASA